MIFHFHKWVKTVRWHREGSFIFHTDYRHCAKCKKWQEYAAGAFLKHWKDTTPPDVKIKGK